MATVRTIPGALPPLPAVSRILARFDRPKLAAFIAIAIDLLDTLDGEPDEEDRDAEDCFDLAPHCIVRASEGAGCNLSDPDSAVDDRGCDEDTDSEPDCDAEPRWLPALMDNPSRVRDLHAD